MSEAYDSETDTVDVMVDTRTHGMEIRKVSPIDLIDPRSPKAPADTRRERMAICKNCERLTLHVCRECGCFMPLKTWLGEAVCPIGKWSAVIQDSPS